MPESHLLHPIESQRLSRVVARNHALHARFVLLHHTLRQRHDDVYGQLADEFFLTRKTVLRILRRAVKERQ